MTITKIFFTLVLLTFTFNANAATTIGPGETLAQAIATQGTNVAEIIIDREVLVNEVTIVPANITLTFVGGGVLRVDSSQSLIEINGTINAPATQIFNLVDSKGKLTGSPINTTAYPEWFGLPVEQSCDDTATLSLTRALSIFKDVKITNEYYLKGTGSNSFGIRLGTSNQEVTGGGTVLVCQGTTRVFYTGAILDGLYWHNLNFEYLGDDHASYLMSSFSSGAINNSWIENNDVRNFKGGFNVKNNNVVQNNVIYRDDVPTTKPEDNDKVYGVIAKLDNLIAYNTITNLPGGIMPGDGAHILENTISMAWGDNGIYAASSDNGIIEGNVITNTFADGIALNHSTNMLVISNVITNPGNAGIRVQNSIDATILSNDVDIRGCGNNVIRMGRNPNAEEFTSGVNIKFNSFTGRVITDGAQLDCIYDIEGERTPGNAIYFLSFSDDVTIESNTFQGFDLDIMGVGWSAHRRLVYMQGTNSVFNNNTLTDVSGVMLFNLLSDLDYAVGGIPHADNTFYYQNYPFTF